MAKYTPGPWELNDWTVRARQWDNSNLMADCRGNIVCDLAPAHGGRDHAKEETKANGDLIAAAPELLEAAEKATAHLEIFAAKNDIGEFKDLENLYDAIKKAKGGK